MIELLPLTVAEYSNLENTRDYDFAMLYAFKFTDPVDEYNVGDVMELPFGFIKDFQFELEHGLTFAKLVDFVLQYTGKKTVGPQPLDKFCRFANYLKKSIEDIIEIENQTLSYEPSDKEQNAGMDRFKDLGVYLQIRSLTGGDVTKVESVRALPYSLCFTELFAAKQLYEYNKELNKPPGK